MVREAQKYKEGRGWLSYDSVIRRNNQGAEARWDILDPSLHTAFVAGQGVPAVVPCRYCSSVDHPPESCAMAMFFPLAKPPLPARAPSYQLAPRQTTNSRSAARICLSWNKEACRFPGSCYYKHVCSSCGENHMASKCPRGPPNGPVGRRGPVRQGEGSR